MNYRMVIHTVGQVVLLEAGMLILPLLVSLYYGDACATSYVQAIAVAAAAGALMTFAVRPKNHNVFAKEGFSIVSISWLLLSAIGALPFVLSGEITSYVDAFFETVSGFTTTGASILTDVEAMSRSNLFWRSFTHWVGGMGVLVLPLLVSFYYHDGTAGAYFTAIAVALVLGCAMTVLCRTKKRDIFAREGFTIVSVSWLLLSAIGALPFVFSGEIPSYVDAFFETFSGFTTTGASILTDVEAMSRSNLFWRSFTHWVGGMGVLVLVTMLANKMPDRSMNILRAEMPGPIVGKLVPRAKDTSRILYLIYLGITAIVIIFLLAGGMPLFDSVVHAFGTAGTGGFGIKGDSIAGYSPYLQWVITIGMLAFGINFNIFFLMILRRFGEALRSTELWTYLGIVGASVIAITCNIASMYESVGESLRHAAFQVSSIVTTQKGFDVLDDILRTE